MPSFFIAPNSGEVQKKRGFSVKDPLGIWYNPPLAACLFEAPAQSWNSVFWNECLVTEVIYFDTRLYLRGVCHGCSAE